MLEDTVVLYVEDDKMSQIVVRLLLQEMGINQVTIWSDSHDFINRVESLNPSPNLIFLDIHVEPYTGFEMLKMLRESEKFSEAIVVALTASVMNEEVNLLKNSGFNSCLAKPINGDSFPSLVRQIVEGSSIWRISF